MDALMLGSGQFYLFADSLIAILTLMMAAVAECITIPTGMAQLPVSELPRAEQEVVA